MHIQVSVENIKCGGCANSIRKQLQSHAEVESVDIDIALGQIDVQVSDDVNVDTLDTLGTQLRSQLLKMGYPEVGSVDGLKAAGAKAKSFVSCAVGKLTDDETKQ